ncbi:hypothetical protein [Metapseudomonas resinovorans]|uniref:Uncharacterized protein n=1 Tax=Metapseudomonas resinovorans NBRC 106553 TaxID=1245471 RepID=S6AIK5_METRE|nr:hypothetical protein [Pseudomonas resinovorans]BAN50482.1 hypothetical protein PCA10_47500 [Pseudomonas resinovorans NBRC 106553]
MLFRLLVFLYPVIRPVGPAIAALLFIAGLSLIGYAVMNDHQPWIWLSALGCLLVSALLALLCHSYLWWLFKLRPRGCLFIPIK